MAYALLGWSPADFWQATPLDFHLAYRGWQKFHGRGGENPLSREEMEALFNLED